MDKLQKSQNRCLRSCFDIYDPMEIGTLREHELVMVNTLNIRREAQLLNIMLSLKLKNKYKTDSARVTRNADRFELKTYIVHKDIYAKSPYFRGVSLWNSLPIDYQNLLDSRTFKNNIKKLLNIFCLSANSSNCHGLSGIICEECGYV